MAICAICVLYSQEIYIRWKSTQIVGTNTQVANTQVANTHFTMTDAPAGAPTDAPAGAPTDAPTDAPAGALASAPAGAPAGAPANADAPLYMFDLCAGIGGFSYALRSVAQTVVYAEKDPHARSVLSNLMRRGVLSNAPVLEDVASLVAPMSLPKPHIICAGFPCQDLSAAGHRAGLHGPRSSLFFTVRDVVATWRPPVVLLENVPCIRRYMDIIRQAMADIGYQCTYDIFSAHDVGAPHLRKRWYCVCRDAAVTSTPVPSHALENLVTAESLGAEWAAPPPPDCRVTSGTKPGNAKRLHALGNSIVPQCARHAFAVLHARAFGLPPPGVQLPPLWSTPIRIVPPSAPENSKAKLPGLDEPVIKELYHTPRASCWSPPLHLTKRGLSALAAQLVYQDTTPRVPTARANPDFVEWMMGYPMGYTSVVQCNYTPKN